MLLPIRCRLEGGRGTLLCAPANDNHCRLARQTQGRHEANTLWMENPLSCFGQRMSDQAGCLKGNQKRQRGISPNFPSAILYAPNF